MNLHEWVCFCLSDKVCALTIHNSGLLGVGGSHHTAGVISNVFLRHIGESSSVWLGTMENMFLEQLYALCVQYDEMMLYVCAVLFI